MVHLTDLLEKIRHYAARPCIEFESTSYTYTDLLQEMERWRLRFDDLGIVPGCVVGLRSDYSFSAVAALFALFSRNNIVALIPRSRDPDYYLLDAHVSLYLSLDADGNCRSQPVPHENDHPLLQRLRVAGGSGVVIFTSGSTGRPKAALQSLERLLHKFRKPGRGLRTVAFLMFDHIGGLDTLLYTVANGGTLIFTRKRDPEAILALIESHKLEVLPTSPSFLRLLCLTRRARNYDLSSLKIITYGSEPMDANTLHRVNELFPDVQITQKYGTTETGSPRSVSRGNDSLWLKLTGDGVETRVIDGMLWIRSKGSILGYLNAKLPMDDLGWYCTGDLVEVDGEWLKFLGRAQDIINVGGEKVAPTEVEQLLLELEFVSHALVMGLSHALMGQVVTAKVVLSDPRLDHSDAVKRIRQHCRAHLPAYKVPVRIEIVTERFENDRQKMLRHVSPGPTHGI